MASLASLLKKTSLDDHEEVLQAANTVLRASKHDLEALHVKTVALLKLDRYDDALRVLEQGGKELRDRAQLESAYALYKLGRFEEAAKITKSADVSRGMKHVEAQTTYRLEEFSRAAEIYHHLAESLDEARAEESDLRINGSATSAQLEWAGQGHLVGSKKPSRDDLDAFETTYNAACASIARDELGQAAVLLKRARDLCNASEDLSDEEKRAELLPMIVQQLYVASRLEKAEVVKQLSSEISLDDIPELSTRNIAQNNLLASSPPSNPYLAARLFASTPNQSLSNQPFTYQSTVLAQNAHVLDLLCLKHLGVFTSTSDFLSGQSHPTLSPSINTISVLNAAAASSSTTTSKQALKSLLPLLSSRPSDIGLLLLITQLYVLTNNPSPAILLHEAFLSRLSASPADDAIRFAPAVVAALAALYTLQSRHSHARALLASAAAHYRQHPGLPQPTPLLQAAGTALLRSSRPDDLQQASEIFASLKKADANDRLAIAGSIASNATSETAHAEVEKLTSVARLTAGTDVDALMARGVAHPVSSAQAGKKRAATEMDGVKKETGQARTKKGRGPRKSKRPADYEENRVPDPERWLPLRDRASYRPKGRKGKMKAAALTQGGVDNAGEEKKNKPAAAAGVVKSDGKAGGGQKKKKGKGGKR